MSRYGELEQQIACMTWLQYAYPNAWEVMFAIPNEGKTSYVMGKKLKLAGMKAGIPDLFLPVAKQNFNGLFVETKTKLGRLSTAQKDMHLKLIAKGYCVKTCYSLEQFIEVISCYLG